MLKHRWTEVVWPKRSEMATSPRTPSANPHVERLQAEKEDLQRRIKERDERSTELMRQLAAAQKTEQKAKEALAAEQAMREQAERTNCDATAALEAKLSEAEQRCALTQARLDNFEGRSDACHDLVDTAAKKMREAQDALVEAQKLGAAATEKAALAESLADELRAEIARRDDSDAERRSALERDREEMQAKTGKAMQSLALSQEALRREEEACRRLLDQMERERESLNKQRDFTQQRLDDAMALREDERAERERATTALAVAQSECKSLQDLSSRTTAQWKHEVTNAATAWRELEAVRAELNAARRRVEMADKEKGLSETQLEAVRSQLSHAHAENERLEREQRDMVAERCKMEVALRDAHQALQARMEESEAAAGAAREAGLALPWRDRAAVSSAKMTTAWLKCGDTPPGAGIGVGELT